MSDEEKPPSPDVSTATMMMTTTTNVVPDDVEKEPNLNNVEEEEPPVQEEKKEMRPFTEIPTHQFFTYVPSLDHSIHLPLHSHVAQRFQELGARRVVAFANSNFEAERYSFSRGYVCALDAKAKVAHELFDDVDVGFGVSIFDLTVPSSWRFDVPSSHRADIRAALNVLLPDTSSFPPTPKSSVNDYWEPSLGRGGRCGIFFTMANDVVEYKLIVFAGLDPWTIAKASDEFSYFEAQKKTYADVVEFLSHLQNLAAENRRRIAAKFIQACGGRCGIRSVDAGRKTQIPGRVVRGDAPANKLASIVSMSETTEKAQKAYRWFSRHVGHAPASVPASFVMPRRPPRFCEDEWNDDVASFPLGAWSCDARQAIPSFPEILRYDPVFTHAWNVAIFSPIDNEVRWFNECTPFNEDVQPRYPFAVYDYGIPGRVSVTPRPQNVSVPLWCYSAFPNVWRFDPDVDDVDDGGEDAVVGDDDDVVDVVDDVADIDHDPKIFTADVDADLVLHKNAYVENKARLGLGPGISSSSTSSLAASTMNHHVLFMRLSCWSSTGHVRLPRASTTTTSTTTTTTTETKTKTMSRRLRRAIALGESRRWESPYAGFSR